MSESYSLKVTLISNNKSAMDYFGERKNQHFLDSYAEFKHCLFDLGFAVSLNLSIVVN